MILEPLKALQALEEGNIRFANNQRQNRDLLKQVKETKDRQKPFAAIVSCIDSRNPTELIFDQGVGDLFSVRMAGNVISQHVLGSLEFCCKIAGSRLIVILGHTRCGAVSGACDYVEMGNLTTLLSKIYPAVSLETSTTEDRTSKNIDFVNKVSRINVYRGVETVIEQSVILRDMIESGEVAIIGALYHVEDAHTEFLEDTWMCGQIKNVLEGI